MSEQDLHQRMALYWAPKGSHPKIIVELLSRGVVVSNIHELG